MRFSAQAKYFVLGRMIVLQRQREVLRSCEARRSARRAHGARAYNGSLRALPQRGPEAEPLVRGGQGRRSLLSRREAENLLYVGGPKEGQNLRTYCSQTVHFESQVCLKWKLAGIVAVCTYHQAKFCWASVSQWFHCLCRIVSYPYRIV